MSKIKITPKLHFEVGEKVVICNANIAYSGGYYPDIRRFTFTTIKEVKEDGSVVVEEGYVYRQSYETYYGDTTLHDYFRINRVKKGNPVYLFNGKYYQEPNFVVKHFNAWLPTYLYKCTQEWENKAKRIEEANSERQTEKEKKEKNEARKQVFRDAFAKEVEPYATRLYEVEVKAFREHICGHCIHNIDGYCTQWERKLEDEKTTDCTSFEIPKEDK